MAADPYQVLGVPRDASRETVHEAYLALVRRYHPDLHPGDPAAEERLKALNAAYEVLSDPAKRADYDRSRRPAPRPSPQRHRPPPRPATRGAYRSPTPPSRSAAWRADRERLRRQSTAPADEQSAGRWTVLGRPVADEDARRRRIVAAVCILLVLLLVCCRLCVDITQSRHFFTRRATVTPVVTRTAPSRRPTMGIRSDPQGR